VELDILKIEILLNAPAGMVSWTYSIRLCT